MTKVRQEDLQMKIPALLHLSSLGYGYLSKAQLHQRDRKTNILPDVLLDAIERINHIRLIPKQYTQLMEDLWALLDAKDLGKQFYRTIRDGWNGLQFIDFDHPENNLFQSAAELACGSGIGSFRPDITLFVNGLPLAMIEMKTGSRSQGLQSEYKRMLKRFHCENVRRYLQCAQVWAFSDDHGEDRNQLLPIEGTFFATVMTEDFPVYPVHGKPSYVFSRSLPVTQKEERRILEDNGIPTRPHTREFQKSLSRKKPTHRMLTTLFCPERFLFLLRYGIQYIREEDATGLISLTRRLLNAKQLSGLNTLVKKASKGYRNWTVPSVGAAGENAANASLVMLLQDLEPGARLFWISANEIDLKNDQESLESCGISCARYENAVDKQLLLISADNDLETWMQIAEECAFTDRRVFILQSPIPEYGKRQFFSAKIRKYDQNAILVTRTTNRIPENKLPADLFVFQVKTVYEIT